MKMKKKNFGVIRLFVLLCLSVFLFSGCLLMAGALLSPDQAATNAQSTSVPNSNITKTFVINGKQVTCRYVGSYIKRLRNYVYEKEYFQGTTGAISASGDSIGRSQHGGTYTLGETKMIVLDASLKLSNQKQFADWQIAGSKTVQQFSQANLELTMKDILSQSPFVSDKILSGRMCIVENVVTSKGYWYWWHNGMIYFYQNIYVVE